MNTPCLVFLIFFFFFLPDICLLHLQALQYFQELKCNCNQSWKERTEWFNSELINWRSSCFRCHPWVFITRWLHMMTSPDETMLIDFLFWCVLYWIHLGGRMWQENLVKLFANWMQLWGTCSNNPNHVYRIFSPHWSCIWWNNMHNWSKPQRHHRAKHMKHTLVGWENPSLLHQYIDFLFCWFSKTMPANLVFMTSEFLSISRILIIFQIVSQFSPSALILLDLSANTDDTYQMLLQPIFSHRALLLPWTGAFSVPTRQVTSFRPSHWIAAAALKVLWTILSHDDFAFSVLSWPIILLQWAKWSSALMTLASVLPVNRMYRKRLWSCLAMVIPTTSMTIFHLLTCKQPMCLTHINKETTLLICLPNPKYIQLWGLESNVILKADRPV